MRLLVSRIAAASLLVALAAVPPPATAGARLPPATEDVPPRELAGPRWLLRQTGDETVATPLGEREAFLAFDAKLMRFSGSGGCNRITGSYQTATGDRLTLGSVAVTRMACPNLNAEAAFLRALGLTRGYRISGRHLDLLDGSGKQVARLEDASDR